jgi:DNA-binding GntR family transcriptional regulator
MKRDAAEPKGAQMPLQRPKSLTELVVEEVRRRIVAGELQLGEALSENVLAQSLGISKTPVREALLRLKLSGLVDIQPQRGTFVFQMDDAQVRDLSEYRAILETAAIVLAITRQPEQLVAAIAPIVRSMGEAAARRDRVGYRELDWSFHQTMFDHCGNENLRQAYAMIAFKVQALRNRLSTDDALNETSLQEHRDLLDRMRAKDAEGGRDLLRRHIEGTKDHYLAVLAGVREVIAHGR